MMIPESLNGGLQPWGWWCSRAPVRSRPIVLIRLVLCLCLAATTSAFAQPFVVINTNDAGAGSLRQAIIDANNNPGPDTINFDIPGLGPHVIAPISTLPFLQDTVVIDGYSQPATLVNSAELGSNAIIDVVLDGTLVEEGGFGLVATGSDTVIKGLSFIHWRLSGIQLGGNGGHVVSGNWFGIAPDGSAAGNLDAISVFRPSTIGAQSGAAPTLADRNLIANSRDVAIAVGIGGQDTRIQNNFIGTDPSGTSAAGNMEGIQIVDEDVVVGGLGPLEQNVIAWSARRGVYVREGIAVRRATIRGNRIYNNQMLGIDLAGDGVTENDPPENLDGDSGPNGLQNFPVLVSASNNAGQITVTGELDSAANRTFDLDFYSNTVRDSGPPDSQGRFHGEGESFLGTIQVVTNGAGHADFNVALPEAPVGAWISTTATDPDGNTSEFSTTIAVPGENCTVTNTDPSGPGSFDGCLDEAAGNGNNDSEVDFIGFNVPGGGTIPHNDDTSPFSPNIIIDFSTQPGYVAPTPDGDPCTDDGTRPIVVEANPPDLDLFDGVVITGIDLVGSSIIKAAARGVDINESRMTATLPGAGLFLDGDFSSVRNSVFVPFGDFPGMAVVGNSNQVIDSCANNGIGIFASASSNRLERIHLIVDPASGNFVVGGSGNSILELRTTAPSPRAMDGPAATVTIDLGGDGHTENDPLDADEGPNDLQNHPVISVAETLTGAAEGAIQSRIEGILDSEPDSTFRIDAYANSSCSPNDYGPAERYLGFVEVTTDMAGHSDFLIESMAPTAEGEAVVATATNSAGSTSELSACLAVTVGDTDLLLESGFE